MTRNLKMHILLFMLIFMITLAGIAAIAGSAMVAAAMAESIDAPFLQVAARQDISACIISPGLFETSWTKIS